VPVAPCLPSRDNFDDYACYAQQTLILNQLGAALLERRIATQTSIAVCLEVVEQQA
jgi:hypothetical protein